MRRPRLPQGQPLLTPEKVGTTGSTISPKKTTRVSILQNPAAGYTPVQIGYELLWTWTFASCLLQVKSKNSCSVLLFRCKALKPQVTSSESPDLSDMERILSNEITQFTPSSKLMQRPVSWCE